MAGYIRVVKEIWVNCAVGTRVCCDLFHLLIVERSGEYYLSETNALLTTLKAH